MKYDLIFSMGEACSCSELIRLNNYQDFSYPFDWVAGLTFLERAKILADDFKNFINKEDLIKLDEKNNFNNCFIYKNKVNNIFFNHDFYVDIPFDEMYITVKEKYKRRIKRLLEKIEKSKNILMVYIETPLKVHEKIENKDILEGFSIIKSKYPDKNINLLYCTNSKEEKTEYINDNVKRVYCFYKDLKAIEDHIPDFKILKKILKKYKFKMSFKKKIKIFLINLIPFSEIRKYLKKKYHIGFIGYA